MATATGLSKSDKRQTPELKGDAKEKAKRKLDELYKQYKTQTDQKKSDEMLGEMQQLQEQLKLPVRKKRRIVPPQVRVKVKCVKYECSSYFTLFMQFMA